MGLAADHPGDRFCTIEINKGRDFSQREFDCTVKINGEPKDVWYYGRWVSYNRVMKLEGSESATFTRPLTCECMNSKTPFCAVGIDCTKI